LIARAYSFAKNEKRDVLLVLNHQINEEYDSITRLKEFEGSIQWDENYYLYLLKYKSG
jgi:hypothetical protein